MGPRNKIISDRQGKKMKKIKLSTILIVAAILVFASVIGVTSAIAATVEGGSSELNVSYGNLSFENDVHILYAVGSDNANIKLLVWETPQSEYTYGTQDAMISPLSERKTINGKLYTIFKYNGLAAKQMADDVYVRTYIPDTGEYGAPFKYSILQYAYNKMGKTGVASTDAKLIKMLGAMLEYGAAAQEYHGYKVDDLANAEFVQIKLTGGTFEDGFSHGLFTVGSSVAVSAPDTDADGLAFEKWIDSEGNTVSTSAYFDLTVGNANAAYTAVYSEPYSKGLKYNTNGDGTCYVDGIGSCTDKNIVIPSRSPNGDTVTAIGSYAFYGCKTITGVTIPASVKVIESQAFTNCPNLAFVKFGENSQLTAIEDQAFHGCKKLMSVEIPENVTSIGSTSFYNCIKLVEVFNKSSLSIEKGSSSYGYVGNHAMNIYTPDSGSSKLDQTSDGYVFCSNSSSVFLIGYVGDQTDIVLPDSYNGNSYDIRSYAFYECTGLTSVTFGQNSNVTIIGSKAFGGCSNLTSIKIPSTVTSIGESAFINCTNMISAEIPSSVLSIGNMAFSGCSNLTIYAEAESKPSGWSSYWNYSNCTVNWGYNS